jgi:magnesium transporter
MSETNPDAAAGQAGPEADSEVPFGPTPELVRAVREALQDGLPAEVEALIAELHPADIADLVEQLSGELRTRFLDVARHRIGPETLSHLDDSVREEVVDSLTPRQVAAAVQELDTDDAVDLLEDLDDEAARRILDAVPAEDRAFLEQGLTYPEDSAGRLMQRELVAVPSHWTVGETIDFLRAKDDLPDDFYDLFIMDADHRPVGSVPLSRAIRSKRAVKLTAIMESELRSVPATMDQESVAYLFRQYGLVSAPVIDEAGRLIGVVTVDDVVHVIEEETEEDLMGLSGVGEADFHAPALITAWRRMRWLIVTLINTLIASSVISRFGATIEQLVALAVLMPIVAAMGGNAGMQVVTVTVRALATRDLSPGSNVWRSVGKEMVVASINAAVFALLMGAIAATWFHYPALGGVLAAATVVNMMWAGLAGTVIPMALARMGLDPAIAAGPFLTTTTDVLGFFSFLGLATLFLV